MTLRKDFLWGGDKKQTYNVMSVPCLVINGDKVFFGKKNIEQILDLI